MPRQSSLESAYDVIRRFVDDGRLPGAVAQIGSSTKTLPPFAYGSAALIPESIPVQPDTIYDCASLTKVVCTTTLALLLVDEGRLHLNEPVARYIPELNEVTEDTQRRSQISVGHLLTHTSGLPGWKRLYQPPDSNAESSAQPKTQRRDMVLKTLYTTPLETAPGTQVTYSCLGYILLGILIERITDTPLDLLAHERIFDPLGMNDTGYNPPDGFLPRIAPTERLNEQFVLRGVVHDENARALGGVSGNAGLFSTALDLARFAQMILRRGQGTPKLLSPRAIAVSSVDHTQGIPGAPRGLGWLLKESSASPAGDLVGNKSFGHTGFTGTSLWIDPENDLFVVLLTNRVHPSRSNSAHLDLRPLFHNAIAAAWS